MVFIAKSQEGDSKRLNVHINMDKEEREKEFAKRCPDCKAYLTKKLDADEAILKKKSILEELQKNEKNLLDEIYKKQSTYTSLQADVARYKNGDVKVEEGIVKSVQSRLDLARAELKEADNKWAKVKDAIIETQGAIDGLTKENIDYDILYKQCVTFCNKGKTNDKGISFQVGYRNIFEDASPKFSTNGFVFAPHYNFGKFGAFISFSYTTGVNQITKYKKTTLLAGGRWYPAGNKGKIIPFVNAALGTSSVKWSFDFSGSTFSGSSNGFTYNVGGGASLPINLKTQGVTISLFTEAGLLAVSGSGSTQSNFTIDAGIKIGFGK